MIGQFQLTEAEVAFITTWVLEGFHPGVPGLTATEAFQKPGLSFEDSCKTHEFKYLWQEQAQIDIFTETGGLITASPAPCHWHDAATFLRRWNEILPEIMARTFEKNYNPDRHRLLVQHTPEIWCEVEVNPFTAKEAEFLDALAEEVRTRTFGPCLQSMVVRRVPHFQALNLVERRWFELEEQGRDWPQPHRSEPPCPWADCQAFKDRFERELNPHLHYPRTEAWDAKVRSHHAGSDTTNSFADGQIGVAKRDSSNPSGMRAASERM